jgi:hypothetical protein
MTFFLDDGGPSETCRNLPNLGEHEVAFFKCPTGQSSGWQSAKAPVKNTKHNQRYEAVKTLSRNWRYALSG